MDPTALEELGMEFDVCEDGAIVSEHGTDAASAVNEAARLRAEGDADVVTILVTSTASREANA